LNKTDYFLNYDNNNIDEDSDMNSDSEISATNQENAHLVLLTASQKSDLLIYFKTI